jgi:outer membrane biosynthesis protein TonB
MSLQSLTQKQFYRSYRKLIKVKKIKMLRTKHERKSAVITAIILLLIAFGIIKFGMTYLDPPEEYGVAINFGDSNFGKGVPVTKTKKSTTSKVEETKEQVVEKVTPIEKIAPKEIVKEDVITEETKEEVTVIEKNAKKKEILEKPVEKVEPKKEIVEKVEETKPIEKPKPKPSKENQDALNALLNGNATDGEQNGEGDDAIEGTKGKQNGDENSSKYYGSTNSGSGGNYNLAGRNALSKPKQQPNCQEEGIVVVRIQVDKFGKVIYALPGVKGTTNSAPCLLEPAKKAALATKWNADNKAPQKQTGTIIYKFSLTQ